MPSKDEDKMLHARTRMKSLKRIYVVLATLSAFASTVAYGQTQKGNAAQPQAAPAFSVLYTFTGGTDGSGAFIQTPEAPLVLDRLGNLYGTTTSGGDLSCGGFGLGCGVVFKVERTGTETVLYSFHGAVDGEYPLAGVLRDPAGNLYGTTNSGGTAGGGVVYKLNPTFC